MRLELCRPCISLSLNVVRVEKGSSPAPPQKTKQCTESCTGIPSVTLGAMEDLSVFLLISVSGFTPGSTPGSMFINMDVSGLHLLPITTTSCFLIHPCHQFQFLPRSLDLSDGGLPNQRALFQNGLGRSAKRVLKIALPPNSSDPQVVIFPDQSRINFRSHDSLGITPSHLGLVQISLAFWASGEAVAWSSDVGFNVDSWSICWSPARDSVYGSCGRQLQPVAFRLPAFYTEVPRRYSV
jgi:hypothetical protein